MMFEKMDTDHDSYLTKGRDEGGAREVHAPQGRVVGRRPPGRLALGFYESRIRAGANESPSDWHADPAGPVVDCADGAPPLVFTGSPSW
jgi:hypothetical protein